FGKHENERKRFFKDSDTIAASLDVEHDSGGRPRCQEAMGDTIAQTRVLDLENVKDAQALEIKKLKKRFKKLERKNKSRTLQLKRRVYKPRVESSKESLGKKDASKQGRNSDKTEELNVAEDEHMFDLSDLANTEVIADQEETIELVEDKGSAKKGVSTAEDKDSTADPVTTTGEIVTTASVNPEDSTAVDASLADDVTFAETLIAIRCSALRPQKLKGVLFKEPSEPTTTSRPQPQISAKDKGKGIMEEPEKLVKVKGKDQIEYDADVAQRLQAELNEEVRLEREREKEAKDIINYQIIRANGSTKYYRLFSAMLNDFDRQDVLDLYMLVKERFETTSPEGYDRLLWGDLITLFQPCEEDEIWKTQ
ncbi:hypothetical protein Tco_1349189, partial [Tanacetum coccineum]